MSDPPSDQPAFLCGGGETGALIAGRRWDETPLGPIPGWPQSLKAVLGLVLRSKVPMVLLWGEDGIMLYNDAYSAFAGARHPSLLGSKVREGWPEVSEFNDHVMKVGLGGGTLAYRDQELTLHRYGWPEQVWMDLDYSPVLGDSGEPAGVLAIVSETTQRVQVEAARRESETRFRQMADAVPQIVWITDVSGGAEFFNRQWYTYTGAPPEALTAADVMQRYVHPDDAEATVAAFEEARRTGSVFDTEHRIRSASGEYRWFLVRAEPYRDPQSGEIVRWFGGSIDIHDRREAAITLRRSEERFRFLDQLSEATHALTDSHEIMGVTARLLGEHIGADICAYADMEPDQDGFTIRGDWAAPGSSSIVGTYSLATFGATAEQELRQGRPLVTRDTARELGPEQAQMFLQLGLRATVCMPFLREGRLAALMAVHSATPRDWTEDELALVADTTARSWAYIERTRSEAALRESEAKLRTITDALPAFVWFATPDGELHYFNERWFEYTGQTPEEALPNGWADTLHPDDAPRTAEHWSRCRAAGESYEIEVRYRRHDGVYRWYSARAEPLRDESGQITRWFGTSTDIHERKLAEAALRELNDTLEARVAERAAALLESERRFRAIFDTTFQLTGLVALDGTILVVNKAALDAVGATQEQVAGIKMWDAPWWSEAPDEAAKVRKAVAQIERGGFVRYEAELGLRGERRTFDFSMKPILDDAGKPAYLVAEGRDITDQKQAETALRQSQKMEAMGQLTGGVAHDFNNLLTPIVGSLDLLQRRKVGDEREQRLIANAAQSAERAKTLVQRLLAFARRQPLQPVAVNIPQLVSGMADLIAATSGPQIKVVVDVPEELPPAKADPNQLEMALLNLGVNARDAMPDGGTLRISAAHEQVGAGHPAGIVAGGYIRLSVADTGVGMDEDVLARAIEPFFSTKGIGKGTGLGLSMVHGLVSQLGGALTISSRPGLGTNAELWLPQTQAENPVEEVTADTLPRRDGSVLALLVDDEESVRISTADMLAELGYQVVEASSGEAALRDLQGGLTPDLLVTDHLMPGMSGTELSRAVRALLPDLPILIISGYADLQGIDPLLPRLSKPFRAVDLATRLAEIQARGHVEAQG